MMFSEGISKEGDLVDLGTEMGIIKKSGSFYSFGDIRLGQGRENSKNFLRENAEISDDIEGLIRDISESDTDETASGVTESKN
jgi:recombination protein RecA